MSFKKSETEFRGHEFNAYKAACHLFDNVIMKGQSTVLLGHSNHYRSTMVNAINTVQVERGYAETLPTSLGLHYQYNGHTIRLVELKDNLALPAALKPLLGSASVLMLADIYKSPDAGLAPMAHQRYTSLSSQYSH